MAIVYFSSLQEAETVEVNFVKAMDGEASFRLLVDSGFTGQSSFVLSQEAADLAQAFAPRSKAAGALRGAQKRIIVSCRIPQLGIEFPAIAILANLSRFALPTGIDGLAGLRFLRHFRRWGAERRGSTAWRFFLETATIRGRAGG
jgi:hypothetical protein